MVWKVSIGCVQFVFTSVVCYFQDGVLVSVEDFFKNGYLLSILLFTGLILMNTFLQAGNYLVIREGVRLRGALQVDVKFITVANFLLLVNWGSQIDQRSTDFILAELFAGKLLRNILRRNSITPPYYFSFNLNEILQKTATVEFAYGIP